jgi:hypothetical protein
VKESDVMIFWEITDSNGNVKTIMKPVRVVMNNFTVSFFESSNYNSNIITFDIEKTHIFVSKKHAWCTILQEKKREMEFCPFSMNRKDTNFKEEWTYDFELFKNQCHVERSADDIEEEIKYRLKAKIVSLI